MTWRNFCFTLNNYCNEEEDEIYIFFESYCKYGIYGKEVGKEGTKHLQGFFIVKSPMRLTGVIKNFTKRAHLEVCKGNAIQNYNYCWKDNNCVEYGNKELLGQGKRNDIIEFAWKIRESKITELFENFPKEYIKYYKATDRIKFEYDKQLLNKYNDKIVVEVLVGKPGSGKTRYIFDKHGPEKCFKLEDTTNIWFDGYEDEEVFVLDDFYGGIKYSYLLNLLDKYHMRLPIKGGFKVSKWNFIYITWNKNIDEWYGFEDISALKRRINKVTCV